MNNKIQYSIIIPHYKSIDSLAKCIHSIPERKDIQVIIVDDNSGIEKSAFESSCLKNRQNVLVIYEQQNNGAGHARNVGLREAKGNWILFADADDYFSENAFCLCDKYVESNFDIVFFGICGDNVKALVNRDRHNIYNQRILQCDINNQRSIDELRFSHNVPWGKMIRHDIIINHNIQFDEIKYGNDVMFSTKLSLAAKNICVEKHPLYCVTAPFESLTAQETLESCRLRYQVLLRKNELLRKAGYGDFQTSIIFYLLKFRHYGLAEVIREINIGLKSHANFFVGSSQWGKKILKRIIHRR